MPIKKGQEVELTIESLAYGGKGISRVKDFVIFVKNTIPGQKVRALVYRKRKGFGEAFPIEILSESSHLVDAPCPHFLTCGGCKVQQLDYKEQIAQKKQQVENNVIFTQIKLDFDFNAFIPDNYIQRNEIKIDIYKKLNLCNNNEDLNHLSDEIKDRYGTPPVEMINLLTKQSIIINARHNKIEYIELSNNTLTIRGLEKINHRNLAIRIKEKVVLQGNKKIVFEFIYDKNKKLSKMKEIVTNFK